MATALLRTGIRSMVISRGLLEKTTAPVCCAFLQEDIRQPTQNLQLCQITKCMYSNRHVRQTVSSTNDYESDSDDEKERGQSPFWRRKMRTLHSHLDVNKDGVISYEDFMLLGNRFSKLGHLSAEATKDFKKVLNKMWEEQWGEISPYNLIGVEKYIEKMHHVLNDSSLKKKCHHFLPFLFKAVDKDRSGEISIEEFKIFFTCLGLTHDHAVVTFSHIDTNDDGKLSLKEFVTLGRDFILTEDQTRPSKHFWGPLVD